MSGCRISRAAGPQRPRQANARGHVLDQDRAVVRRVRADPGRVVLPECRARDDAEALFGEPSDREVALDPAALVEHLRVRDRTDIARDAVVAQPFEEPGRARSDDVELGEGRLVEEGSRFAAGTVLGADRRRPEPPCPAARAQRLVTAPRVRLEPVRALPAGLLAEDGAELLQPLVGGRKAQGSASLALVPGILDVVVGRVDLERAGQGVGLARIGGAETARVHLPDVEARARPRRSTRRRACPCRPLRRGRERRSRRRPRNRARRTRRG